MAHRAVDSFMGPRGGGAVEAAPAPAAAPQALEQNLNPQGVCENQVKAFAECMSKNSGDMGACQYYFDAMQHCKMSQPYA